MRRALTLLVALAVLSPRTSAYVLEGPHWYTATVPYYVNVTNNQGLVDTDVRADIHAAADAWPTQAGINLHFIDAGITNLVGLGHDGINTVNFFDSANAYFGAETYWWYIGANQLVEFDIALYEDGGYRFYDSQALNCDPALAGLYVDDTLTHEFGHAVGLAHTDVVGATMYQYLSDYCDRSVLSLEADDIAGARTLYAVTPPGITSLTNAVTTDKATYSARQRIRITSQVTDQTGTPVAGATVTVLVTRTNYSTWTGAGTTDSNGQEVEVYGVGPKHYPTGTYTIRSTARHGALPAVIAETTVTVW